MHFLVIVLGEHLTCFEKAVTRSLVAWIVGAGFALSTNAGTLDQVKARGQLQRRAGLADEDRARPQRPLEQARPAIRPADTVGDLHRAPVVAPPL
jgi:hypothetical protein